MTVTCPRCSQGHVKQVLIGAINRRAYLCDECDATWACNCFLDVATFVDFSQFVARQRPECSLSEACQSVEWLTEDDGKEMA